MFIASLLVVQLLVPFAGAKPESPRRPPTSELVQCQQYLSDRGRLSPPAKTEWPVASLQQILAGEKFIGRIGRVYTLLFSTTLREYVDMTMARRLEELAAAAGSTAPNTLMTLTPIRDGLKLNWVVMAPGAVQFEYLQNLATLFDPSQVRVEVLYFENHDIKDEWMTFREQNLVVNGARNLLPLLERIVEVLQDDDPRPILIVDQYEGSYLAIIYGRILDEIIGFYPPGDDVTQGRFATLRAAVQQWRKIQRSAMQDKAIWRIKIDKEGREVALLSLPFFVDLLNRRSVFKDFCRDQPLATPNHILTTIWDCMR